PAGSTGEDVQARTPSIPAALSRVGVTGVEKVIRIHDELFFARLECFVDLGSAQKGAHMSRFDEVVNETIARSSWVSPPSGRRRSPSRSPSWCASVKRRRAEVTIEARYPEHKPAPVSG